MAKENGSVVGRINFTTQNYAVGAFNIKSQFNANYNSLWPRSGSLFLAVAHNTSPYFSVYPFSTLGFGSKLSDPATLPTGNAQRVRFSPKGNTVAVAHTTTPYVSAYPFTGAGIGTKYSNPATLPGANSVTVGFNSSANAIAVGYAANPGLSVYTFSSGGFGSKYSDAATLPGGTCYDVAFHPNGNEIATGGNLSPYFYVYPWTAASGFGTKYANHPNIITSMSYVTTMKWHPSGNFIAVGNRGASTLSSSKIERVYGFNSGTGFNTTYFTSGATTEINGATGRNVDDVDFSPDGSAISYGVTTTSATIGSNYVVTYAFNTSTGYTSLYSAPATLIPAEGTGTKFDSTGKYLAVSHLTTPFITVYNWSSSGYGSKITNPVTLPASTGNGVDWGVI